MRDNNGLAMTIGLEDEYELIGELGRGGASIVYLARERLRSDNITVAVMECGRVFQPQDIPTEPLEEQVRQQAVRHSHSSSIFSRL